MTNDNMAEFEKNGGLIIEGTGVFPEIDYNPSLFADDWASLAQKSIELAIPVELKDKGTTEPISVDGYDYYFQREDKGQIVLVPVRWDVVPTIIYNGDDNSLELRSSCSPKAEGMVLEDFLFIRTEKYDSEGRLLSQARVLRMVFPEKGIAVGGVGMDSIDVRVTYQPDGNLWKIMAVNSGVLGTELLLASGNLKVDENRWKAEFPADKFEDGVTLETIQKAASIACFYAPALIGEPVAFVEPQLSQA